MQVSILNGDDAKEYIQIHQKSYNRDPIDTDIKDHLKRGSQPYGICWLEAFETFKVNELSLKRVMLV